MIEFIRAVVRPALALMAGGGTVLFVALSMLRGIPIPGEWWLFLGAVTTFYYTQRHEEKNK